MATDMQKLIVTSEDDEEEEDGTDMDVKEEDGDSENRAKHIADQVIVGVDVGMLSDSFDNQFQYHQEVQDQVSTPGGGNGGRKCRPLEEKERTKLRERHRRAITARILAGLRRHGNYNLRVRADINDVIAALAREAGWVVLPDGTTFPSRSQGSRSAGGPSAAATQTSSHQTPPQEPPSIKGISPGYPTTVEYNSGQMKSLLVPSPSPYDLSAGAHPQNSVMMGDGVQPTGIQPLTVGTVDTINVKQIVDVYPKQSEREFAGSAYVPVYVMLPVESTAPSTLYGVPLSCHDKDVMFVIYKAFPVQLGVINMKCELADPDGLLQQLRALKSADVDGVKVDCWWGIVEAHAPQEYNWHGYKKLCQILRQLKLKLQVIMSFHECGGNVGDDVCIPLPHWVAEIGRSNPDIFFTDNEGRRNPECLSWGIDKERVLRGRTAVEVYFDYMRNFRVEFDEFFEDGVISMVEIGLGPCGDLRYPSNPVKHGWRYPGIGEFQCYDQYLMRNLRKAAEGRGHPFWARVPDNCGSYNSQPHETGFFCDGGDYDGYHGRFFLNWYSQVLVDHGDLVLSLSKLAFEGTCMTAKLPSIHWWYKTASHAAELNAGFYNSCNRDGYGAIVAMLKKHGASLNFCFSDLGVLNQRPVDFADGYIDSDGLFWQVLNAAWDASIQTVAETVFPCHDRLAYNKILDNLKPLNDPDGRHSLSFTYHRLNSVLMERHNFLEFRRFVKRMHGEAVMEMHVQV